MEDIVEEKEMNSCCYDVTVTHWGKEATCNVCGEAVYVSSINDYNIRHSNSAVREELGIIQVCQLKMLMKKLGLDAEGIADLLNVDGIDIVQQYLDGVMPSIEAGSHLLDLFKRTLREHA